MLMFVFVVDFFVSNLLTTTTTQEHTSLLTFAGLILGISSSSLEDSESEESESEDSESEEST